MAAAYTFGLAKMADAGCIAALINAAYRGESSKAGWTTEADLLNGLRTTESEIAQIVSSQPLLHEKVILCCWHQAEIIGTVCLERDSHHAAVHVGMFVVQPVRQGAGIGKALLDFAENYASVHWHVNKAVMHVITARHELIDFYQRRGYLRTGITAPFPENAALWQPKVGDLRLELLEKQLR